MSLLVDRQPPSFAASRAKTLQKEFRSLSAAKFAAKNLRFDHLKLGKLAHVRDGAAALQNADLVTRIGMEDELASENLKHLGFHISGGEKGFSRSADVYVPLADRLLALKSITSSLGLGFQLFVTTCAMGRCYAALVIKSTLIHSLIFAQLNISTHSTLVAITGRTVQAAISTMLSIR